MSPKRKQSSSTLKAGDRSVVIGGSVSGSTIIVGDQNVVATPALFEPIYRQIATHPKLSETDKEDAQAELREVEAEVHKPEPDASFLERRLRNLRRIAPDVVEVVLATLASPAAGFSLVAKKVAEKMRAEVVGGGT